MISAAGRRIPNAPLLKILVKGMTIVQRATVEGMVFLLIFLDYNLITIVPPFPSFPPTPPPNILFPVLLQTHDFFFLQFLVHVKANCYLIC